MPIYEYQCGACGHRLESIQKMTDLPLTDCPACHKGALQKLVSAAGFQLKGTGWYATDFRNKGKSEPAATISSDNKNDSKSESKSEIPPSKPSTDTTEK